MTESVVAKLRRIDALLRDKLPGLAGSLRPGVKARPIERLGKLFGGKLPRELGAWFRWHDGRHELANDALIPETNWCALSCERVVGVHAFLTGAAPDEIMQPWKPAWIPLFENGGGNHLCLDRETGAVIVWRHDDRGRPKAYKSFGALIDAIERGYARMKKPASIAAPPRTLRWEAARVPTAAQIGKLPPGTVYRFTASYPGGKSVGLRVKLSRDRWLECSGRTTGHAIDQWRELSQAPPAEASGYYSNDANVRWELGQEKTTLEVSRANTG